MTKHIEIFGDPVEHSQSPQLHEAVYKKYNLDFKYDKRLVSAENLKKEIETFKTDVSRIGLNITIPHKEKIKPLLDSMDPFATVCGAVNTVVKDKDGSLIGYNTDGPGFWDSLKTQFNFMPATKNIVVLGSGGAAKGIVASCYQDQTEDTLPESVTIGGRTLDHLDWFSEHFPYCHTAEITSTELLAAVVDADLLINATSLGMAPQENETPLVDFSKLTPAQIVSEIVYAPKETVFVKNALTMGCQIHYGRAMLVAQAALALMLHLKYQINTKTLNLQDVTDIMSKVKI